MKSDTPYLSKLSVITIWPPDIIASRHTVVACRGFMQKLIHNDIWRFLDSEGRDSAVALCEQQAWRDQHTVHALSAGQCVVNMCQTQSAVVRGQG